MLIKDTVRHDLFDQINGFRLTVKRAGSHYEITANLVAIVDASALANARGHARRMRGLQSLHLTSIQFIRA